MSTVPGAWPGAGKSSSAGTWASVSSSLGPMCTKCAVVQQAQQSPQGTSPSRPCRSAARTAPSQVEGAGGQVGRGGQSRAPGVSAARTTWPRAPAPRQAVGTEGRTSHERAQRHDAASRRPGRRPATRSAAWRRPAPWAAGRPTTTATGRCGTAARRRAGGTRRHRSPGGRGGPRAGSDRSGSGRRPPCGRRSPGRRPAA